MQDREKRDRLHDLWKIQLNDLTEDQPDKIYNYWRYVGQLGASDMLDDDMFESIGFLHAAREYVSNLRQQEDRPVEELLPELVDYLDEFDQTKFKADSSETSGGLSTS